MIAQVPAMIGDALEALHDKSVPTIGLLQQSLPDSQELMVNISVWLDPRYVFLVYAPILFALNKRVGHRMIIALTCCEWSNQVLKWLLAGERPYWYVHERSLELANKTSLQSAHSPQFAPPFPELKQFPVTCELGAGSPSGHAMVTATVWYVLIDAYLKSELKLFGKSGLKGHEDEEAGSMSAKVKKTLGRLLWAAYLVVLVAVSLSRVYLACHFPHQCLCGALLGCALARLIVERLPMERLRPWHFVAATGAMFASALATYALLRMRGFNPLWSVDKAMRWCERPENIHLDTTPFYSMMRYLGFCLGAGLAYEPAKLVQSRIQSQQQQQQQQQQRGQWQSQCKPSVGQLLLLSLRRALVCGLSIGFGQLLLAIPLARANLNLYYAISFLIYTIFAYSFATLIPDFVKSVVPTSVSFEVQTASSNVVRKKKLSMRKCL